MIKANWTSTSAFNLELAIEESQDWIQRVIDQKFPSDFQTSLRDGIFLCRLINQIQPNSVPKYNSSPSTDFSKRENLQLFIKAAKNSMGLRDTQLFESQDLFESIRIRNLSITLYWLGRAARSLQTYKGPQLDLLKFQGMNCSACKKSITNNDYLTTMTQQFHTSCTICCSCSCKLDPKKKFYQESNSFWCENCMLGATSLGGPSSAKNKVTNNNRNNNNKCLSCFGSLEKGYVPDEKDKEKKYCTDCICDLCHDPLVGNFQVKDGKKICDSCSCKSCGKSLEDGYHEEGISKYCEPCAKDRNKQKSCHEKDSHNHHIKAPTTNTSNSPTKKKSDSCKICNQPVTNKTNKYNDDRDTYCTPHEKEGTCGKCHGELTDSSTIISANDKNFHQQCFKCDSCNKVLNPCTGQIKKSPRTGNPLCHPCSNNKNNTGKSSKTCHDCNEPISGSSVEALDRLYHPNCLKCYSCSKNLKEDFREVDNEPFCNPCASQLNRNQQPEQDVSPFITSGWLDSDRCVVCVKPLSGEVTKIFDSHYYHKGCFKCTDKTCNAPLITGYFLHDKKPYCQRCSIKIQLSTTIDQCTKCTKPIIEGSIVKVVGKVYHKSCYGIEKSSPPSTFSCFKCRDQITGQFVRLDQKDYCMKCSPSTSPTSTVTHGERLNYGMKVDPRSGKRVFNTSK
ncbi:hypothetical protein RB653_007930 [Dictyostelium firmibasis]|uniref:Uncharacterized protein n=1 Tax=Dictyostelium firmibasis TaxID=79012 RepID=A0AAN7YS06_9MYCE